MARTSKKQEFVKSSVKLEIKNRGDKNEYDLIRGWRRLPGGLLTIRAIQDKDQRDIIHEPTNANNTRLKDFRLFRVEIGFIPDGSRIDIKSDRTHFGFYYPESNFMNVPSANLSLNIRKDFVSVDQK